MRAGAASGSRAAQAERRAAAAVARMSETLQRSLLTEPPQPDGLQIAVRYRPAAHEAQVGGDWYDAFVTAGRLDPRWSSATSPGHDRDAAAAMGQMRNLLRGVALHRSASRPAPVLAALDRAMRGPRRRLARDGRPRAGSSAPVDGRAARLRWSNAGHPPPLLVAPDGSARLLQTAARPAAGPRRRRPPGDDHARELHAGQRRCCSTPTASSSGASSHRGGPAAARRHGPPAGR